MEYSTTPPLVSIQFILVGRLKGKAPKYPLRRNSLSGHIKKQSKPYKYRKERAWLARVFTWSTEGRRKSIETTDIVDERSTV